MANNIAVICEYKEKMEEENKRKRGKKVGEEKKTKKH